MSAPFPGHHLIDHVDRDISISALDEERDDCVMDFSIESCQLSSTVDLHPFEFCDVDRDESVNRLATLRFLDDLDSDRFGRV